VYVDPDGAKETIYIEYVNEQTGKTTVYKMTSRALLMTDGKQHKVNEIGENHYYVNHYYDFSTTFIVTKKKDGSVTVQKQTKILVTETPKDYKYVWLGGQAKGAVMLDKTIPGMRGDSPCEWCGDNSGSVQQGGIVFSGENDAASAAEMYRDAIGKNITVVEGDILDLASGFSSSEPENIGDLAKQVADGLDKLVSSVQEAQKQIKAAESEPDPVKTNHNASNSSANSKPPINSNSQSNKSTSTDSMVVEYQVIMNGDTTNKTHKVPK
jgi:hypothetical protein